MKPSYAPDNTRSSIVVIALLAAGISLGALLIGLSDKPDVSTIGVSVTPDEFLAAAPSAGEIFEDETGSTVASEVDDPGFSVPAPAQVDGDEAANDTDGGTAAAPADSADGTAAATIPAATAIPAPTPTAEIQAAVDPTPLSSDGESDPLDGTLAAPQIAGGTVGGSFFTRADEDEGAMVTRNEVSLTLETDGTGTFSGALEMTLADTTAISLSMSGDFRWSTIDNPQVMADLIGTYVRNGPVETEDIQSDNAELTISSLGSGSGSLCAPTCFGFTFPTQTGF